MKSALWLMTLLLTSLSAPASQTYCGMANLDYIAHSLVILKNGALLELDASNVYLAETSQGKALLDFDGHTAAGWTPNCVCLEAELRTSSTDGSVLHPISGRASNTRPSRDQAGCTAILAAAQKEAQDDLIVDGGL